MQFEWYIKMVTLNIKLSITIFFRILFSDVFITYFKYKLYFINVLTYQ